MESVFVPSYKSIVRDIERRQSADTSCRASGSGANCFDRYVAAREHVVELYYDKKSWEELVDYFRSWITADDDNEHLVRLTDALLAHEKWPLLKTLWDAILKERRGKYKEYRRYCRAHKDIPAGEAMAPDLALLERDRQQLLGTLRLVIGLAEKAGAREDIPAYAAMLAEFESDTSPLGKARGDEIKDAEGAIKFKSVTKDIVNYSAFRPCDFAEARRDVIEQYLARGALKPMVSWLRCWRGAGYTDDVFVRLNAALSRREHWPLQKSLWERVIRERTGSFNAAVRAHARGQKNSAEKLANASQALIDPLREILQLAEAHGEPDDAEAYRRMLADAKAGRETA